MTSHPTPDPELYVTFRQALPLLQKRMGATKADFVCWIFFDELKAYCHVHEFAKPPEFNLAGIALTNWQSAGSDNPPYINALDDAFFLAADIDAFDPPHRYITFADLVQRWLPHCETQGSSVNFIRSRVHQSRLRDFAPWLGETELSRVFFPSLPDDWERPRPPADWAMFKLAEVEAIEAKDFPSSNHNNARIFKQLDPLEFEKPNVTITRPKPQIQFSQPEHLGIEEPKKEPRTLQRKQENAIIEAITSLNHSPKEMPSNQSGSPGIRSDVREYVCEKHPGLFPKKGTVFKKAWERMSEAGEICYRQTLPPQKT